MIRIKSSSQIKEYQESPPSRPMKPKKKNPPPKDPGELILLAQLNKLGLTIKPVVGDGYDYLSHFFWLQILIFLKYGFRNCLFRALAYQLFGELGDHSKLRADIVNYIVEHRSYFEPFMEDDEQGLL